MTSNTPAVPIPPRYAFGPAKLAGLAKLPALAKLAALAALTTLAACGRTAPPPEPPPPAPATLPPPLPDTTGWGVHVLAVERAPDGAIWVGSYGRGIFVLRPGAATWEPITPVDDDSTSISWGFVNAFAFPTDGSVWYGTVGNGFGRSADAGRTWRSWTFDALGPEWQYVAPNGIRARGDTVYIATADGLRITADGGRTWRCIQGEGAPAGGAEGYDDLCAERAPALPTEYLLALETGADGRVWVGHLHGLSLSSDGGRTWRHLSEEDGMPRVRVRGIAEDQGRVWLATEVALLSADLPSLPPRTAVEAARRSPEAPVVTFSPVPMRFGAAPATAVLGAAPRALLGRVGRGGAAVATSSGMLAPDTEGGDRVRHYLGQGPTRSRDVWAILWLPPPQPPIGGTSMGLNAWLAGAPLLGEYARPGGCRLDTLRVDGKIQLRQAGCGFERAGDPFVGRHRWLRRPIGGADGNPYIDQTYRYGSTMGGNFQQHQGVEFNNPAGTPVRAAADGRVIFAGAAEAGARTVAIVHDRRLEESYVVTTYYHNSELRVEVGQRVRAGQVIARVGNTGRATNDHLHFEVHVGPANDPALYVDPDQRFPPYTVNPQLWLEPIPGTGVVAGRVLDAAGQPLPGARVYGLKVDYPVETPFSFAETYMDRGHADPVYRENFAVGDVVPGRYMLGVDIGGEKVWRTLEVEQGKVTWVEFRPPT